MGKKEISNWCFPYLEDASNIPSIRWYIWLETRLIDGRFSWKGSRLFTSELKIIAFKVIQRRNSLSLIKSERKKYKNTLNISLDGFYILFEFWGVPARKNISLYHETLLETGTRSEGSLRGGNRIQNLETFWINNKTIIKFGFRLRRMFSTSANNILLDLHNSSHLTQPHSIITKYPYLPPAAFAPSSFRNAALDGTF